MDSQEGVKWRLVEGDVLFSHINSDKHLGKVAVYHESEGALYHGVNLLRLELYKDVCDPQYFWYYCNAARTVGLFEAIAQHAVNQSSINQRRLREVPFVLPPLKEQRRIAAKLDALSGRTSRVRVDLDRLPVLVSRYKQALLAAAFRGDLTADWRILNPISEDGNSLRTRLLQEREEHRRNKGVRGKGANRSIPSDVPDLPPLPPSWAWMTFEECSWDLTVGHVGAMKHHYVSEGVPFLRSMNVKPNVIDTRDIIYCISRHSI